MAPAAAVKAKAKPLTRAQKLTAALKVCKKEKKKPFSTTTIKTTRKKTITKIETTTSSHIPSRRFRQYQVQERFRQQTPT